MGPAPEGGDDVADGQDAGSGGDPRRVLVVSAGMGAGHHAAADELIRRLREQGHVAERVDVLQLGRPGQGERLQRLYAFLLRRAPWVYDLAMRFWARWPGPLERFTARSGAAYERGLLGHIDRFGPDVAVSVFNLSSQALGRLRARGRLGVPVASYVIDPGPHPYWLHPAVDLYLALLPETARALDGWGARRTVIVPPLVQPRFFGTSVPRDEARRRLGLGAEEKVALVSAGSWATGEVERSALALARSGAAVPVTLCGRNDVLRDRLTRRGAGLAIGWTDDVPAVMAAADVFVDNAGGVTFWEAVASGLPVVFYQPLPGHGRINVTTLEAAGLARYARSEEQLVEMVRTSCRGSVDPAAVAAAFSGDAVGPILRLTGSAVRGGAR